MSGHRRAQRPRGGSHQGISDIAGDRDSTDVFFDELTIV
jgi:hypothetical protein